MNAQTRPTKRTLPAWVLPIAVVLVGCAELTLLTVIAKQSSMWWALAIVLVGWIVGFALLLSAGQQSITRIVSLWRSIRGQGEKKAHMSRPAFTLLAALCFFFPGILTDLTGIILLFTPVQKRVLKAAGLDSSSSGRRVLFSRTHGGVIDGEIIIDSTQQASENQAAHSSASASNKRTSPPALEGDVL